MEMRKGKISQHEFLSILMSISLRLRVQSAPTIKRTTEQSLEVCATSDSWDTVGGG